MAFVCSYCGYESDGPGDCPECGITLLEEEEPVVGVITGKDEDEDPIEEW